MTRWLKTNKAAWIILSLSILLITGGILRGEMGSVFIKAIRICFECIGIG